MKVIKPPDACDRCLGAELLCSSVHPAMYRRTRNKSWLCTWGWPCAWGLAVHSWPCGGLLIYDDEVELASVEVGLDDLDADRIAERVCDVMTLSDELECLLVEEVVVRL